MLSSEVKDKILELQSKYPQKRSALIPALHLAQNEKGYLPTEIQREVSELFDIDVNEVNAIVTFYDMFFEEPVGKHILHVCKNVSCMLRGCDEMLQALNKKVEGNKEFTVISSECLAACDRAPMILADDKVYGPIHEKDLDQFLDEVRNG